MIKIDIDFNLNVLLKFFFSLSKKIIFLLPILANNNQVLKIYCENITIVFPSFFPSFFLLHIRTAFPSFFHFFFLFFSPPHMYPYSFLFSLLSSFFPYHFLQTPECSTELSFFLFFYFFIFLFFFYFFFILALRLLHPRTSSP